MKFAIEHSFAARLQRRWTMIAQSSRAYIAGRAPAPGRTRRLVARAPPSMGVGVYGRRCFGAEEILRTSPSFFPKRTCKNCTDIRRNSAMILRVLVGFSSPRRFLTSQPRSAGHLQWLRAATLHRSKPFASPRPLLLEEDFAAGTIAIISLNEMRPRWRMTSASLCSSGTKPSSVGRMERR